MGNLITDGLALRKWTPGMPNTYLHRKVAERWRGEALQSFAGNRQTDQGDMHEEQARKFFASLLEADIEQIGGIESDDGRLWCSPDGLIGESVGLEIKCPNCDTHVGWLLGGGVPEEHMLQVQFSLWVSGFSEWQFLSYCKGFPHLAVRVTPDKDIFDLMTEAVGVFNSRLDLAFAVLVELNGGPPPERKPFVESPPEADDVGIIP